MTDASSPDLAPGETLTGRTFSGLRWSTMESVLVAAVQLVYVALMSRLLDPVAFGLMAMANLAVNFGQNFARMGIAQALIQKLELSRDDIRAGFTAGVTLGSTCFAIMWLLAPWVASVFREPDVVALLRVMSVHFLLLGMGMTSQGLLRRQMRFRELAIIRVAANLLGYVVVGMGLALLGAGVWSLVAAVLAVPMLELVAQYALTRHPLRPVMRWRPFRSLYGYGARRSVLGFMDWAGKHLDTFMVGRYMTTALLGQYSRAFTLINLPLSYHLTSALTKVLFPGFSRIQADDERLRRTYLSVLSLAGLILLPLCAGIAVAANEMVLVALGDQWDVAATVVPWFALAVGLNIMSFFAQLVCEARAELSKAMTLQGAYLVVLAVALVAVSGLDLWVFAATLAVCEVLRHATYVLLLRNVVQLRFSQVARAYGPPLFAAAAVAVAIFATRQATLAVDLPLLVVFLAEVTAGAVGLSLGVRLNPVGSGRQELRRRMAAAGLLTDSRSPMRAIARLALGRRALSEGQVV